MSREKHSICFINIYFLVKPDIAAVAGYCEYAVFPELEILASLKIQLMFMIMHFGNVDAK